MKLNHKRTISMMVLSLILVSVISLPASDAFAISKGVEEMKRRVESIDSTYVLPFPQQRVHRMSEVNACMTNWGLVGSQGRDPDMMESIGGCFMENPDSEVYAPSFEFPAGSELEHLWMGGIWIGAIINDTIYTSVGCDGWQWIYELWPDKEPEGAIIERTTIPEAACYSPDALSHQDIIAVYTDTSADIPLSPQQQDPWDNRKHHPLNVRITQKSYSWDIEGYDKFIIAEYTVENTGYDSLKDVYIGFYMDCDIGHIDENPLGPFAFNDDITGFLHVYEGDTVNIAWMADNDGHGVQGETTWTEVSPRSVIGMKILRTPNPDMHISYNWWSWYPKDWGPWIASNQDVWESMNPYGSGNLFPNNVLGTPGGDVSKYFLMSNGEIDYDQIFSCVWPDDHPEEGWLPPSPDCNDLANGFDTRFLFSFGPFDQITPGDSLIFAVGFVIGESLHVDPLNLLNDPYMSDPYAYYDKLYFGDLVNNALMAERVYHDITFNDPPDPFSLLFPPNKAFTPRGVRFDWETATDPNLFDQVTYDLYVSTSYHSFLDSATIDSNLVASEHAKILDYGTYYWKVKAKDNRGAETWSTQIRYFMVTGIHPSSGDFNGDGSIDVADVVFLINYLYTSGPAPDPLELGDVNCDDMVDIADVVYLINYLFIDGPPPGCME